MKTIKVEATDARESITAAIEAEGCCILVDENGHYYITDAHALWTANSAAEVWGEDEDGYESEEDAWLFSLLEIRHTRCIDNLEGLNRALKWTGAAMNHPMDLDGLPTFGGEEPADTTGVWSWDETSLLVGTCWEDLDVIPR